MKEVDVGKGKYDLSRVGDGYGMTGGMKLTSLREETGEVEETPEGIVRVGWRVYVNNLNYWFITSTVTEILYVGRSEGRGVHYVKFRTENSVYGLHSGL